MSGMYSGLFYNQNNALSVKDGLLTTVRRVAVPVALFY